MSLSQWNGDAMTRKGTPRPGNGGARQGAGRKPTTKPLRMVKLDDDTAAMLAELTIRARFRESAQELSQTEIVSRLIKDAYEIEMHRFDNVRELFVSGHKW